MPDQEKWQQQRAALAAAHKPQVCNAPPARMSASAKRSSRLQKRRVEDRTSDTSQKPNAHLEARNMNMDGFHQQPAGRDERSITTMSSLNYSCRSTIKSASSESKVSNDPDETTGWGIDSSDGVIVGHPPDVPPGLLDWTDEDQGKPMAGVSKCGIARTAAAASAAVATRIGDQARWLRGKGHNCKEELNHVYETSDYCNSEEDSDWVRV